MFAPPLFDPGMEMVVSSLGMSKGIKQAEPVQVIPKAYVQIGGLQIGAHWKNVSVKSAEGEAAAFANASSRFGEYSLIFGAAYKFQTGVKGSTDPDSFEFSGALTRKAGRLSLRMSAIYSPDDLGATRRSLYLEGGPSFELTKSLKLSANVGRRTRERSPDYTSMNIGATMTLFRAIALDARYYRTNRGELGDTYRRRWVVSGRWSF